MSKIKMRCNTCGKWFQSANAKEVTCPDCMQKARKEKLAAKSGPLAPAQSPGAGVTLPARPVPPPPKPKPTSTGGSHWLDQVPDVKVGQPDEPPRPKLPAAPPRPPRSNDREPGSGGPAQSPGQYRDERGPGSFGPGGPREGGFRGPASGPGNYREGGFRGPGNYRDGENRGAAPYRVIGGSGLPETGTIGPRPRQPMEGEPHWRPRSAPGPGTGAEHRGERFRPGGRPEGRPPGPKPRGAPRPKVVTPPKPKREKIPPPAPFVPTEEQVAQIEARYAELAVPVEFDGIRTQIAQELGIPKVAVKKIVKAYRDRMSIPSWWELQTYKGTPEELEKIKAIYEPTLPLPPVGIHKQIAEQLELKPVDVYQAIKAIRQEMNLPQFNDPALHGIELKPRRKPGEPTEETPAAEPASQESAAEPSGENAAAPEAQTEAPVAEQPAQAQQPSSAPAEQAQPAATEQVQAEEVGSAVLAEQSQPPAESAQPPAAEKVEQTEGESAQPASEPETPAAPASPTSPPAETVAPAQSHDAIRSIETDTLFQRDGDTIEVTAASSERSDA